MLRNAITDKSYLVNLDPYGGVDNETSINNVETAAGNLTGKEKALKFGGTLRTEFDRYRRNPLAVMLTIGLAFLMLRRK